MPTEVLVGVIGLGGAVVGALAAFLGVVYQQRHQAKLAAKQRLTDLSTAAVDVLMVELEAVRRLAWTRAARDHPMRGTWIAEVAPHVDAIRLAALRLTDRELREMIEAACVYTFGDEETLQEAVGLHMAPIVVMSASTGEAQKCLGYYLRQEPTPETIYLAAARRTYRASITTLGPGDPL
ncbi:hypothetical protein [Streptomyces sp. NPDC006638]|uniref:hypothetical protein n=1 Tax=Streptomyces sp. NPDC006638 TaxID=3157183 RepID=UPI0033B12BAD